MRNLVLILIAFIAVVTFIRAFEKPRANELQDLSGNIIEIHANN